MASQGILNQSLFEDHQDHHMSSSIQMGFFSSNFPQNYSNNIPYGCSNINQPILRTIPSSSSDEQQQPLPYNTNNNNTLSQSSSSTLIKLQKDIDFTSKFGGGPYQHQLLSLQRSSPNLWSWGEVNYDCMSSKRNINGGENISHLGISAIKMKKIKARRKVREPRFCFKTLSDVDVLDDGYKWRKYGQKVVKNTQHPRSYYRCTQDNCRVKKRVERLAEDPRMVITTYEGRHIHSPSHDEEDSQASSQVNSYFW